MFYIKIIHIPIQTSLKIYPPSQPLRQCVERGFIANGNRDIALDKANDNGDYERRAYGHEKDLHIPESGRQMDADRVVKDTQHLDNTSIQVIKNQAIDTHKANPAQFTCGHELAEANHHGNA